MTNTPKLRFKEFSGKWKSKKFKDIVWINQGLQIAISDRYLEDGENRFSYITNEFLNKNSDKKYYIENPPSNVICKKTDILMTRTGNTGRVITGVSGAFHNNFFKINYDSKQHNQMFLYHVLTSFKVQKNITRLAGTSTIPDLNHGDFYNIKISYPTLEEQEKIASFFSLIDKKIELQTEKVEELKNYKKGIIQKIFSQELRFKDENGNEYPEWEEHTLGKLIKVKSIRNKDNKVELVLSVSNTKGFITQAEQFEDRVVASSDISNYKIVEKDDFAFNPARINVGSVARLKTHEKGIISPMYVCFNCLNLLDSSYFEYFLMTHSFDVQMKKKLEGSVRQTLSAEALSEIKIKLPTLLEQKKIGEFLNKISAKIEKEEVKLVQLEKYKKGLLQQMFI